MSTRVFFGRKSRFLELSRFGEKGRWGRSVFGEKIFYVNIAPGSFLVMGVEGTRRKRYAAKFSMKNAQNWLFLHDKAEKSLVFEEFVRKMST